MIALLIVAYAMIDSKYAWVVLGLAISIQEELWLPMLLLVAYSANNQGIRRGAKNAVGAIFVFILVNGYFIIQSPSSFFSSVFSTLGGSFLPNGTSSAGFELSRAFPILLSTYSQLFEVTALLMVFLLLYWNRKELIPLFSMVPFLVTVHSISSYYVTFLFLLIFAFCTWDKKEVGQIERIMRKDKRIVYASVAAFFLVLAAIICLSHAAYVRDFNVSMGGAQLTLDWTNSTSIYRTTLNYEGLNNRTLYVYAISSAQGAGISVRGFMNDGIIPGAKAACGSYDCMLKINKITLPQNASSYPLTVIANWDNKTVPTRYFAVELYNGDHFVSGSPEQNFSTFSPS
jgi:hypothetical protein